MWLLEMGTEEGLTEAQDFTWGAEARMPPEPCTRLLTKPTRLLLYTCEPGMQASIIQLSDETAHDRTFRPLEINKPREWEFHVSPATPQAMLSGS